MEYWKESNIVIVNVGALIDFWESSALFMFLSVLRLLLLVPSITLSVSFDVRRSELNQFFIIVTLIIIAK